MTNPPAADWRRRALLALIAVLPVLGCAPQPRPQPALALRPAPAAPPPAMAPAPRRAIGLLLPLSGPDAALGEAMLNAATLALFTARDSRVELLPRDTRGNPDGAAAAARAAIAEGAAAIAGPLTRGETAAVAPIAREAGVPVFALTSDTALAGPGVWVLGLGLGDQVARVTEAASFAGARRFGMLGADDAFGQRAAAALREQVAAAGLPPPVLRLYPARTEAAVVAAELAAAAGAAGLDAVLLTATGERARAHAVALAAALPRPARLLGTALWLTDPGLGGEPALAGAWFPAPDPAARRTFEAGYAGAFGTPPPPLASVAYDAAALAARLAVGAPGGFQGAAFQGADGPLRPLPGGELRRGLALFALDPFGPPVPLQPAVVPPPGPGPGAVRS